MHKWRRHAKYAAWYDKNDEPATYNPFHKVRSRTQTRGPNAERQLEEGRASIQNPHQLQEDDRALSDPDFRPQSAIQRERQFRGDQIKHSSTVPDVTSEPQQDSMDTAIWDAGTSKTEQGEEVASGEKEKDTSKNADNHLINGGPKDESSGKTLVGTDPTSKPRRRRGLKNLFKKNKDEDGAASEEDPEKPRQKFTAVGQLRATILNSYVNVLLLAVPVGIALHPAGVNPIIVFVVNFVAIIPLAGMLSYATEEIALRTGETLGGLLNATFGNAVELIVSIIALLQDQITITKTSLIGSMLSNLLLVMGMCFFFGGLNRVEQKFNVTVAQTAASLLALSIGALIIPTAFESQSTASSEGSSLSTRTSNLAPLSRGTAILLLIVYGCYLFFQLRTHIDMYNAPSEKTEKRSPKKEKGEASRGIANIGGAFAASTQGEQVGPRPPSDDDEGEQPQLSFAVALFTLAASTVLVAVCAEFMMDSIDAVSDHISKTFVGLILIPIVGNAAEHATAVTVAIKDKMDLAIGVAVGSSMQVALLVLPFIVILGWMTGHDDMTLFFDTFQIAVLFIAVLLVNYLIQDGKSHWLEGVLLQCLYILIALAAWFYG